MEIIVNQIHALLNWLASWFGHKGHQWIGSTIDICKSMMGGNGRFNTIEELELKIVFTYWLQT